MRGNPFAGLVDGAGVDVTLVVDSVNAVSYGEDTTVVATMEQMYHGTK